MKKLALFFLMVTLFLTVGAKQVWANNANNPPQGIKTEGVFQTPEGSNSSVLPDGDMDIVQVTPAKAQQKGAIWSSESNKLDLTKDFEASAYLYFGDNTGNAADGMAFVLHNDPKKNNVIGHMGPSLGVWQSSKSGETGDQIKNSFAVEFDTVHNTDFDKEVTSSTNNHIAWAYPDKASTYTDVFWHKTMHHNDIQFLPTAGFWDGGYFANDSWRPFVFKWNAAKQVLTYKFDVCDEVSVHIDPQDVFKSTQVYWGFTGSTAETGTSFENNRVVFEKVPGLVNGTASEQVLDAATHESVANKSVSTNQELTQEIDLNYLGGKQEWQEVTVSKKLNNKVSYIPGTLKLIDKNNNVKPLPDSDWSGILRDHLEVPLGTLNYNNSPQKIVFNVRTTSEVSSEQIVTETSDATGSNFMTHTEPVQYKIKNNQAPVVNLDNDGQIISLKPTEELALKGTWLDADSEKINLFYQIDDLTPDNFGKELANEPMNSPHDFATTLKPLSGGQHKISLYAIDSEGTKSNVGSIIVNVSGTLDITGISDFSFGTFDITGENQYVFPLADEKITISDTRGAGSRWQLNARLKESLTSSEGKTLDMFYLDENPQKMDNEFIPIKGNTTADSSSQDITFEKGKGIAVDLAPSDYAGDYHGKIEWQLTDVPE